MPAPVIEESTPVVPSSVCSFTELSLPLPDVAARSQSNSIEMPVTGVAVALEPVAEVAERLVVLWVILPFLIAISLGVPGVTLASSSKLPVTSPAAVASRLNLVFMGLAPLDADVNVPCHSPANRLPQTTPPTL